MKATRKLILLYIVIFIPVFTLSIFIHEVGHIITVEILGGSFDSLYVHPGIQIFPEFNKPYQGAWPSYSMMTLYSHGPEWDPEGWEVGLVELMGAGTNFLISVMALLMLFQFKPKGILRIILVCESWMFIDMLSYTVLPQLNLPHYILLGGTYSEPMQGAIKLGISATIFTVVTILISVFMVGALFVYFYQSK